jgi:hypothetical protein
METHRDLSDQLEQWFRGDGPKTLGGLIDLFGEKSFAIAFVILMAIPALPLPTGGVVSPFELITMLLALELVVGRRTIWLPERWRRVDLARTTSGQFADGLLRRIRWLERHSRPRLRGLTHFRLSGVIFGFVVFVLALVALVSPPFSGLDTLPALGVVLVSLGILLEDVLLALAGLVVGAIGALLVFVLGSAVLDLIRGLV